MTIEYIHDNLWYDLIITHSNGQIVNLSGKIDYVTEHLADGVKAEINISDSQPSDLQTFVNRYKNEAEGLSIEEFYRKIYT